VASPSKPGRDIWHRLPIASPIPLRSHQGSSVGFLLMALSPAATAAS
jgi:hypothetical protein